MEKWILKKTAEKRAETGHPWVFSNEIKTVKGPEVGDVVQLYNSSGRFLALGFANPASLISFRRVSLDKSVVIDFAWLKEKIIARRNLRDAWGLSSSRRILHGEMDGVPGCVVDEFVSVSGDLYWSMHIHSAGVERIFRHKSAKEFFDLFAKDVPKLKALVLRRDSNARKLETIPILEAEVAGDLPTEDLQIHVDVGEPLKFFVNLKSGQKGGFFLDQRFNVSVLRLFLKSYPFKTKNPRILDAFCYCGQWGVGLGQMLKTQRALEPFVQFADSSESALKSAERNAQEVGLKCEVSRFDLVENEWPWKELFDIVVCDPPALIKSKKHYFAGRRAYLKAVLRSLNSLQKDGLLVLSSCSFHLAREDLKEIIMEASQIIKTPVRILHDFSAPVDHLRGPEFPEGDYLKGLLCIKDA